MLDPTPEPRPPMFRTLSLVWTLLGVIVGVVSLSSLIQFLGDVSTGQFTSDLLGIYRQFATSTRFVLFDWWTSSLFPGFRIPMWVVDFLLVLTLVLASGVFQRLSRFVTGQLTFRLQHAELESINREIETALVNLDAIRSEAERYVAIQKMTETQVEGIRVILDNELQQSARSAFWSQLIINIFFFIAGAMISIGTSLYFVG